MAASSSPLAHEAVDFYFDFSSNNTYFAFFMVRELCRRVGVTLNMQPLYLGVRHGTGRLLSACPFSFILAGSSIVAPPSNPATPPVDRQLCSSRGTTPSRTTGRSSCATSAQTTSAGPHAPACRKFVLWLAGYIRSISIGFRSDIALGFG